MNDTLTTVQQNQARKAQQSMQAILKAVGIDADTWLLVPVSERRLALIMVAQLYNMNPQKPVNLTAMKGALGSTMVLFWSGLGTTTTFQLFAND